MEKISIITTVKNGEAFIKESLLTVLKQTYQNYEHIIVNDGSTDSTIFIVDKFIADNPSSKIRIIETFGVGRGVALNLGVEKATGNWVAILDADDLWHSRKLEIQLNYATEYKISVLATTTELFYDSHEVKDENINRDGIIEISLKQLLKSNKLSHSSVLMRKEYCRYDTSGKSQLDFELWLRLRFTHVRLFKTIDVLSFHRIHKNQSFEGQMGKLYRRNSYKLKMMYCIKAADFAAMIYNTAKLTFDLVLTRTFRLKIKKLIK